MNTFGNYEFCCYHYKLREVAEGIFSQVALFVSSLLTAVKLGSKSQKENTKAIQEIRVL